MPSSAKRLRRLGFVGRLAAAAGIIYIGSIVSIIATPMSGAPDRPFGGDTIFSAWWQTERPAHFLADNNIPNSSTDIDESDVPLDLNCDNLAQDAPHLCILDLDAVTLRTPEVIRLLHVPVRCFYCVHECIRERAPPTLNSQA